MAKLKKVNGTDVAETTPIVIPSLHFVGDTKEHIMQTLMEGDDSEKPILKSVGYAHIPAIKGQASHVSYIITSQGDKILKIEVEEPSAKYIAEEASKIAFVNLFMSGEPA